MATRLHLSSRMSHVRSFALAATRGRRVGGRRLIPVLRNTLRRPSRASPVSHGGSRNPTANAASNKAGTPFHVYQNRLLTLSEAEHRHGWKPVTLSFSVLILFAIISLLLLALIEFCAQWTLARGGLAIVASQDDLPVYVKFSYQFLPTIIAVFYSLFWSWVDLDAKRMQPWLELSRPSGATVENSFSLSYPYDFVAFVPFKAFKRRHWPVFCAGTSMVVIFWLITPLQSTIFSVQTITQEISSQMITTAQLLPFEEQAVLLDQSILNEAYAITWLDQPLPPFIHDGPLLPIKPAQEIPTASDAWYVGETTQYTTELECWPATIVRDATLNKRVFHFDNGRGCNMTDVAIYGGFSDNPFKMFHFGYQDSPYVDRSLASPTCSKNSTNQFLLGWTHHNLTDIMEEARLDEIEVTAMFCETSYYKQRREVSLKPDGTPSTVGSLAEPGPLEPLTAPEFNITAFEYLIGAGVSVVELFVQREFPFGLLLEQYPRTVKLGLTWPTSPMVGFAIGLNQTTNLYDFQDPESMIGAFRRTHKLMFSLAMHRVMQNTTQLPTTEGTMILEMEAVVADRVFSAIVEALLGLVALSSLTLAFLCHRSPTKLTSDPSSLGSLIEICRGSTALLKRLSGLECLTDEELSIAFAKDRFKLVCGCQSPSGEMSIDLIADGDSSPPPPSLNLTSQDLHSPKAHYTPIQPWALRRDVGALILVIIVGVCTLLIYLKVQEQNHNGLQPPDVDFLAERILFAFLPTAFATFFEPFWVLVNRLLCIIQPFRDLWTGRKTAKGSINARYTSAPPQLVFWRAASAGHYLLSAVCIVALLSNLLAVGLSGIFDLRSTQADYEQVFQQASLARFNDSFLFDSRFLPRNRGAQSYAEPFYVAMNMASRGTPSPPWVDEGHYLLPFALPAPMDSNKMNFSALTTGVGVSPSCRSLGRVVSSSDAPVLNVTVSRNGQLLRQCPTSFQPELIAMSNRPHRLSSGPSAAEVVDTIGPWEMQPCDKALLVGWSRSTNPVETDAEAESSFVFCDPVLATATFNVTVDAAGNVLNKTQLSETSTSLEYDLSTNHTESLLVMLNHLLKHTDPAPWHNNSLSRDWMSYLLKIQPGMEDVLSPESPLPDAEIMAPVVDRVYASLFALTLGLNEGVFERNGEPLSITGTRRQADDRIFMPLTAFIISMAVLGINILTVIVLYTHGVKAFLPRMPTTIGSILAYVAPSRAVRQYSQHDLQAQKSLTFSFGRYIGDDGRAHVGIELDPHVVPVKLSALKNGDTLPRSSTFSKLVRRRTTRHVDTWL